MKTVSGGVCAAKGFKANGIHCGIRHNRTKRDLALIMSEVPGITIEVPGPNKIIISGADKQQVGQFAADVRKHRPPEPYKGKGIKYVDEYIRRKEGKAAKGSKK